MTSRILLILILEKLSKFQGYVSVSSKPDHPRAKPQGIFLMGEYLTPERKESAKILPGAQKSC